MELRHLRYFVTTAEEQNISRAAARLHISQPPLSRQIRDLEEELGVTLFERTGKSVRLTDVGRVFWEEARAVLHRAAQAMETVQAMKVNQPTELHLGYSPSLTVELLPELLRAFQRLAPSVKIVLHDMASEEMIEGLQANTLHLALTRKPDGVSRKHLTFHELRRVHVSVACAECHPIAKATGPSVQEALSYPMLTFRKQDYPEYHTWLKKLAKTAGTPLKLGEEHDGAISLVAAVEAGHGVALVAETFRHISGNRLLVRPLVPAIPTFGIGILLANSTQNPIASQFLTMALQSR